MSQSKALAVFHVLFASEQAFKRGEREKGWSLLEQAEQDIPTIEPVQLFARAQEHANRIWKAQIEADVQIIREGKGLSLQLGPISVARG
jgi:hypothetical protein